MKKYIIKFSTLEYMTGNKFEIIAEVWRWMKRGVAEELTISKPRKNEDSL